MRHFFDRRLATELLQQLALRPHHLVDRLDHVHGDADGARLVRDRPGDGLADPPRGVSGELEALCVVELVDRPHQPEVALLDQIEEGQSPVAVALGDRHDEAKVGLNELVLRLEPVAHEPLVAGNPAGVEQVRLGPLAGQGELVGGQPGRRGVALFDRLGDLHLELGVEQRNPANLLEIGVHGVFGAAAGIPARGGPLPVRLATCVRPDGAVGFRHSPRFLGRRHLDDEVFLFVGDERDAFGIDAVDECREHLGCQLDRVQRFDQFGLRELSLGATDRERRVEVDLRHPGRKRDVRDRRQRLRWTRPTPRHRLRRSPPQTLRSPSPCQRCHPSGSL